MRPVLARCLHYTCCGNDVHRTSPRGATETTAPLRNRASATVTLRSLISWDHPEILLCRGHWIGGEVHRHREWLETARRRVLSEWESGASRDDIAERLMQQLYTEEVREFGWVLDLGILSPELYRVEAEALVDAALQSQVTRRKSGRRSA